MKKIHSKNLFLGTTHSFFSLQRFFNLETTLSVCFKGLVHSIESAQTIYERRPTLKRKSQQKALLCLCYDFLFFLSSLIDPCTNLFKKKKIDPCTHSR